MSIIFWKNFFVNWYFTLFRTILRRIRVQNTLWRATRDTRAMVTTIWADTICIWICTSPKTWASMSCSRDGWWWTKAPLLDPASECWSSPFCSKASNASLVHFVESFFDLIEPLERVNLQTFFLVSQHWCYLTQINYLNICLAIRMTLEENIAKVEPEKDNQEIGKPMKLH